jgi:hypothetical protein
MSTASSPRPWLAALALAGALLPARALAQDRTTPEASVHFHRGVELYNEANYTGALVEFQRAYAFAPTAITLFDIGETQFELQDYAGALRTFQLFLDRYDDDVAHRTEVATNITILRSRVGTIRVTTVPAGADVAVDDAPAGTTPLAQPVVVSVGRRKVSAALAGRQPVVRYVDVAAEDDVSLTLAFPAPAPAPLAPPPPAPVEKKPARPGEFAARAATAGWVTTGILGVGGVVLGGLALGEEAALNHEKHSYPASPATLQHDAKLTAVYSGVADGLGAAAVVAGALSLYWTFSASHARGGGTTAVVTLGPNGVAVAGQF